MAKASKGAIWIGVLETSQSSTIVIRDTKLPEASPGRLYLYNSERDQILEYVESIVSKKLRDLNQDELAGLSPTIEKKYRAQRKEFLKRMGLRSSVYKLASDDAVKATPKPEKAVIELLDTDDIDDSIIDDDDWDDDEEIA